MFYLQKTLPLVRRLSEHWMYVMTFGWLSLRDLVPDQIFEQATGPGPCHVPKHLKARADEEFLLRSKPC